MHMSWNSEAYTTLIDPYSRRASPSLGDHICACFMRSRLVSRCRPLAFIYRGCDSRPGRRIAIRLMMRSTDQTVEDFRRSTRNRAGLNVGQDW